MADSSPLAGQSLAGLVSEDETSLKGCADWLRSLGIAVNWLVESLQKCMRAEALTIRKQASALGELRDAARKLSDMLIEGEGHVGVVTAPIAHRVRQEMYALQNPLIAICAETPTGFASWPTIRDQHFDALLAALEGLKAERQHVVTLTAAALEMLRRKQVPESKETNAESAGDDDFIEQLLGGPNDAELPLVDEKLLQIRYDGQVDSITSEGARMVKLLVEHDGEWVAMRNNNFTKPSDVKKSLPKKIQSLIESEKGKGYRIPRR